MGPTISSETSVVHYYSALRTVPQERNSGLPTHSCRAIETAYIPYTQTTFGRLSRMLAKHNINIVALPPIKVFSYLPQVEDALRLTLKSLN